MFQMGKLHQINTQGNLTRAAVTALLFRIQPSKCAGCDHNDAL